MEIVLVKAGGRGEGDRVYVNRGGGEPHRVPVHPAHDLPPLVVESLFDITDGLWGELAAGAHAEAAAAVTARDPKRQKLGRIVSGAASGAPTDAWLTVGHRMAKTVTNWVTNRWGDGPDTPAGVRQRLSESTGDEAALRLLERLDDDTVLLAIRGVHELNRRWAGAPPGRTLRLEWPLPKTFFA